MRDSVAPRSRGRRVAEVALLLGGLAVLVLGAATAWEAINLWKALPDAEKADDELERMLVEKYGWPDSGQTWTDRVNAARPPQPEPGTAEATGGNPFDGLFDSVLREPGERPQSGDERESTSPLVAYFAYLDALAAAERLDAVAWQRRMAWSSVALVVLGAVLTGTMGYRSRREIVHAPRMAVSGAVGLARSLSRGVVAFSRSTRALVLVGLFLVAVGWIALDEAGSRRRDLMRRVPAGWTFEDFAGSTRPGERYLEQVAVWRRYLWGGRAAIIGGGLLVVLVGFRLAEGRKFSQSRTGRDRSEP